MKKGFLIFGNCIVLLFLYSAQLFSQILSDSLQSDTTSFLFTSTRIEELDFKNTDVKDVVRLVATKYNLNVLVDNDVNARVTLHLVNVPVEDALRYIVQDNNLVLQQIGTILKISNPPASEPPRLLQSSGT